MKEMNMDDISRLPSAEAHKRLYFAVFGKELDLERPKDLNEKLQWLMVNRYGANVAPFADKLRVRDYVRKCGFSANLPVIYGVYKKADDIDFNSLPPQFILKCNHGSGPLFYSICNDLSSYDIKKEKKKLDQAVGLDYSMVGLEYQYKYIEPYIYAEELLGENCTDYKFFCFEGTPRYVKVIADRLDKDEEGKLIKHQDYYDMDWNFCPMVKDDNSMGGGMEKPALFDQMKKMAAALSEPFPFARIDLYQEKGQVYFGEITLTPATGLNRTDKAETLDKFGDLVDLAYWHPEKMEFQSTGEIGRLMQKKNSDKKESNISQMRNNASRILATHGFLDAISETEAALIMKDCCTIIGGDFDAELKSDYMTILYKLAFRDDMSLEKCWQIYWNLNRAFFLNPELRLCEGSLDELYRMIFEFVKGMIDYSNKPFIPVSKRHRDRVVIVTSQFLKAGHAPTRRVLDYAYTIQHDLEKKVVLINDGGMHYYEYPELDGVVTFNFLDEYNGADHIDYRGERFDFLQVSSKMPDLNVIGQLVDTIYAINPALVYNIGGSCLTADLCDCFTTVASLPCALNLAVSTCSNLLLGRTLSGEIKAQADAAVDESLTAFPPGRGPIAPYQRIIETTFNFVYNGYKKTYSREQFGIAEHDFVACVVGHRLGDEINEAFVKAVSEAIAYETSHKEKYKQIYVVLVGEIEDHDRIIQMIPEDIRDNCRERMLFTGALEDAGAFLKIADLMLNPDRSGGGRSVFEGLYFGKPVISLRRGDAYWVAGEKFGVDSYDDYTAHLLRYASDSTFYSSQSEIALARAKELSDVAATQKKILYELEVL